jgi:DNA modification methylase
MIDTPTRTHQYVFLFSKSPKYFYDKESIMEKSKTDKWPGIGPQHGKVRNRNEVYFPMKINKGRNKRSVWEIEGSRLSHFDQQEGVGEMKIPDWWGSDKPYRITDVMNGLKSLPDGVIHCVVTSPPYWGLRDYKTGAWEGGDPDCEHTISGWNDNLKPHVDRPERNGYKRQSCLKCGANRVDKQIGLESTPDEYVKGMVEVFREVRRVLRDDGTLWLNLGDSYAGGGGVDGIPDDWKSISTNNRKKYPEMNDPKRNAKKIGLKPKDLVGIPWKVAFALQADGWYLRSDIIWQKMNPMPESVTDRPTKSHEYIFLLSKSKRYFYDAYAIKEKGVIPKGTKAAKGSEERFNTDKVNSRPPEYKEYDGMRNKRSVWTINTKPFSEAHFATFPPMIPEIIIKAGTSKKGCCPKCGAPWIRTDTNLWDAGCDCGHSPIPCIVLDPFLGSGTTSAVAQHLGRIGLGFELNPDYQPIIKKRMGFIEGFEENYTEIDELW